MGVVKTVINKCREGWFNYCRHNWSLKGHYFLSQASLLQYCKIWIILFDSFFLFIAVISQKVLLWWALGKAALGLLFDGCESRCSAGEGLLPAGCRGAIMTAGEGVGLKCWNDSSREEKPGLFVLLQSHTCILRQLVGCCDTCWSQAGQLGPAVITTQNSKK